MTIPTEELFFCLVRFYSPDKLGVAVATLSSLVGDQPPIGVVGHPPFFSFFILFLKIMWSYFNWIPIKVVGI